MKRFKQLKNWWTPEGVLLLMMAVIAIVWGTVAFTAWRAIAVAREETKENRRVILENREIMLRIERKMEAGKP